MESRDASASKKKEENEKSFLKQIKPIIFEEDKVLQEKFVTRLNCSTSWTKPNAVQLAINVRVWGGVSLNVGPNPAISLTAALVPLSTLFTGIR